MIADRGFTANRSPPVAMAAAQPTDQFLESNAEAA